MLVYKLTYSENPLNGIFSKRYNCNDENPKNDFYYFAPSILALRYWASYIPTKQKKRAYLLTIKLKSKKSFHQRNDFPEILIKKEDISKINIIEKKIITLEKFRKSEWRQIEKKKKKIKIKKSYKLFQNEQIEEINEISKYRIKIKNCSLSKF